MTKNEMETYRDLLLKLANHVQGEVDTLKDESFHETDGKAMGNLSNIPVDDRAEQASENFSRETTIGLFENASARRDEINAALDRINEGTFGSCEECGQEIASDRLNIVPFARQCMSCARKAQGEAVSPGNL